jgi:hypothetical protein
VQDAEHDAVQQWLLPLYQAGGIVRPEQRAVVALQLGAAFLGLKALPRFVECGLGRLHRQYEQSIN